MLTLWGGEGTSRLGMVHTESSIVLIYANYSAVARVYPAPHAPEPGYVLLVRRGGADYYRR